MGGALYREHGPSEDGNPALFFFPFYTTLQSSLNYIVAHSSSFAAILYYARLKSSVEYLCIVLFSLYYISQGFLLLIGNFTLSKCTLKLRTCVGTLLNLSVIKWIIKCPSQDGDPVPGNLPFCIIFSFFWIFLILFFSKLRCYSHFITGQEIVCSIFVYSSSRLTKLAKVFFHLFASLPFHALLN